MSLIKCHECGNEVSTEAAKCPKCGAKVKKPTSLVTKLLLGVMGLGIVAAMLGGGPSNQAPTSIETPDEKTKNDVPPIDPKAMARAAKIPESKHCSALGKALRGTDQEFSRAMIQRTADLQLGILNPDQQETIKKRRIQIGMSPCMAVAAWGRPDDINRSVGSFGVHEQWVYPANYLYFEDGVLTSFQS